MSQMDVEPDHQLLFQKIFNASSDNNIICDVIDSCMKDGFDIETNHWWHGESLLTRAVGQRNAVIAKKLLSLGADPNKYKEKPSLLHIAIINRDETMVRLLIEAKININACDHFYNTPLIRAVDMDLCSIGRFLIDSHANVNSKDIFGKTALHFAVYKNHRSFVQMLLEAGADPNILDDYGKSPFDYITDVDNFDVVLLLLNAGIRYTNPRSFTNVLWNAAGAEKHDVVSALIPRVDNVNALHGPFGTTSLMVAASFGFIKIMVQLINAGAIIDQENNSKTGTALSYAILNNRIDAVILLIICGADVNKLTSFSPTKKTKLMFAAERGYEMITKILLAKGAKTHLCMTGGKTAYNVAKKNGHHNVAKIINSSSHMMETMIFMRSRILRFEKEDGLQKDKIK